MEDTENYVDELETDTSEYDEKDNNATETNEPEFTDSQESKPKKEFEVIDSQEKLDDVVEKRLVRERRKLEREYKQKLAKYNELEYLTQQGLGTKDLDDTLTKSREFYKEKGIEYKPQMDSRDEEVLANADAEEILSSISSIDELKSEVDRIEKQGDLSNREKLMLSKLKQNLISKRNIEELEEIGADKGIYESKEFMDFSNKFTKEEPIKNIYDLYMKTKGTTKASAGSLKTDSENKGIKDFYSFEEASKFTVDDFNRNPGLLEAIEKSQSKW